MRRVLLCFLLFLVSSSAFCEEDTEVTAEHKMKHHHDKISTGMVLGISYNPPNCFESHDNHDKCNTDFFNPVVGLDFGFVLTDTTEIILMGDIEYVLYDILTRNEDDVTTHTSTVSQFIFDFALSFGWQPSLKSLIYAGIGGEFGHHESLLLYRFGVEYEFLSMGSWAIKPTFIVDIKGRENEKYTIGVVFSKIPTIKKK